MVFKKAGRQVFLVKKETYGNPISQDLMCINFERFRGKANGYLFNCNYFSSALLELFKLSQKIPKSRFSYNSVWCENPHLIQRSGLFFFRGQLPTNDFIFLQLKNKKIISDY